MELKYKKDCDLDVMDEILMLDPISDEFESISMTTFKGTKENIIIKTKRHFYSHEIDKVTELIESYSPTHPLAIRKKYEDGVSTPAMIVGQAIIAKYAAMNIYKQKTVADILEIMTLTGPLMNALFTGSLEVALYNVQALLNNLPESGSITEDEMLEFSRRLQVEITRLKG